MTNTSDLKTLTQDTPSRSKSLLQKIAELRAVGVGDHISLPQLVVCGDQSAGKSSVLEGITEIPFPRADGVCTKFATEITLTHSNTHTSAEITATIIPHAGRSDDEKAKLLAFRRQLNNYDELPAIIKEVGEIMGLRGFGENNKSGPAFGEDVLSIHEISNKGRHLTVVDLPGLIAVSGDDQTEGDVDIVTGLVESYIKSSRTIIAAIIQAGNDTATQKIIKMAQKVDPSGDRTVGVVTKPDLINTGTEGRIAKLSRNEDTVKLKRGFFIVKNPAPTDLKSGDLDAVKRAKLEANFFAESRWKQAGPQLEKSRVGMPNLFKYLQSYLEEHIEKELPKVILDIRRMSESVGESLQLVGPERHELADMRAYLINISMKYHTICRDALRGNYEDLGDSFFKEDETRLRAQVQLFNYNFAGTMRLKGAKRKYFARVEDETNGGQVAESEKGVTEEANDWIYRRTRGSELPGTTNPNFLTELYHEQSSKWYCMAEAHVEKVYSHAKSFIYKLFAFIVPEERVQRNLFKEVEMLLQARLETAKLELKKLWQDEKDSPMTYNHYYTDNVQKARREELKDKITEVVALKTFVDNVCRQVIERHILRDLTKLFWAPEILKYSDEKVRMLAEESEESRQRREDLRGLKETLESGLAILI
ncbi:hypothetical protein TWF730_000815 [Orbilia blumenaviensis]|uniref:Dynamin GTPase n=1 Tax=Orbilia blumenaviensis TaxID=1796055 RepID=A0AAV9VPY3_9PEZI